MKALQHLLQVQKLPITIAAAHIVVAVVVVAVVVVAVVAVVVVVVVVAVVVVAVVVVVVVVVTSSWINDHPFLQCLCAPCTGPTSTADRRRTVC